MAIKRYLQGIAIVVLILGLLTSVVGITNNPTGNQGTTTNISGESKNFSITTGIYANVSWYINGSSVKPEYNVTSSFYLNSSAQVGTWNVSAVSNNASNTSEMDMTTWSWIVSAPTSVETAPNFTGVITSTPSDTNATITFYVDQANADTSIHYSTNANLTSGVVVTWDNTTINPKNILVSPLSPGTQYYYSVYAYNKTNNSLYKNSSPIGNFITKNPTAPNITSVTNESATNSAVDITFTLNQSDALAEIRYGTSESLSSPSVWKNDSTLTRTKQLTGLIDGTKYYYSVYAYNKTNQSYFKNSTIQNFTTQTPTAPNVSNVTNDYATNSTVNITFTIDQINAIAEIRYGTSESLSSPSVWKNDSTLTRTKQLTGLIEATKYFYSVYVYNIFNQSYFDNSTIQNFTTKYPFPTLTSSDPITQEITSGQSINLTATMGPQSGDLSWNNNVTSTWINKSVNFSETVTYIFNITTKGTYKITANINNLNGSSSRVWIIKVNPTTFSTGNRIWDGVKNPGDFSTTYIWTPQSFSGFFYDAKDDVGSETIKIISIGRSISKNNIIYSTSPDEVSFTYKSWGKYQVIGFMADKYFAGYKNHTILDPTNSFGEVSAIGQQQLHRVLMDEDTKRTISVGGTLALKEGYVLQASDIDLNARTMFLRLLKDGAEVDSTPLAKDETYVYKKRVGSVDDLPLILVRFDNVFSGQELQVAFLKGIFQISEDVTTVKTGNKFGNMEVTNVNKDEIKMQNSNTIGLNKGSIVDLMGDLKIIVADNVDLRFALSVDRKGNFEVRSTIFDANDTNAVTTWTPYNFGMNIGKTIIGFYYNLDDGLGNESLSMSRPVGSSPGVSIPDNELVYTTKPEQVSFIYKPWGKYQVIGFMADQYFAGYKGHNIQEATNSFNDVSAISQGQLHKVLIDDDTKKTISVGGTIALKDGYVLKATDIDLNARTMLLTLLKDGAEVDTTPLAKDETYVYKKTVGSVSDLPIIMVRFDNVFSGQELQVAFLKGIFQLSETATSVKIGDQFGKMDVTTVNASEITMKNDGNIGLDKNKNEVLMGNIRLKVADSDTLRFYFAVDVTAEMIANQLAIIAPAKVMAGDNLKIKITAGGNAVDNASLMLDTEIGTTNTNGELEYTIPKTLKAGIYSLSATKIGYEKATQNIEIEKYVDLRLSIEAPSQSNQFETITIKVLYNGTAMSGASVKFDNETVGTSDSYGEVTYKLETSGTHTISASKTSYIAVTRDIEIRAPYSEFKALDINITPTLGFVGEPFLVKSNITNIGTMSDSMQVDLIVNGTSVDNKTITIGAKEKVEVNFTRIETVAGNVTVAIMEQSVLYEAKENPTNYLLIGAIITGIGAIIIYVLTSKGLVSVEILKEKSILLKQAANEQVQKLRSLIKK